MKKNTFSEICDLLRKKCSYLLSKISNTDQSAIWFSLPGLTTIEHVGKSQVATICNF
jgi:hypothetical protein